MLACRHVCCLLACLPAGGGHASLASEQQYLFLSHRGSKPLLVGQYVAVIQADMGQPLVDVEVRVCPAGRQRTLVGVTGEQGHAVHDPSPISAPAARSYW